MGTLGYVNAGLELGEQVAAGALPEPAAVVVPLRSGGTVAGLLAGFMLAGLRSRLSAEPTRHPRGTYVTHTRTTKNPLPDAGSCLTSRSRAA